MPAKLTVVITSWCMLSPGITPHTLGLHALYANHISIKLEERKYCWTWNSKVVIALPHSWWSKLLLQSLAGGLCAVSAPSVQSEGLCSAKTTPHLGLSPSQNPPGSPPGLMGKRGPCKVRKWPGIWLTRKNSKRMLQQNKRMPWKKIFWIYSIWTENDTGWI